jgi:hypothetical protein
MNKIHRLLFSFTIVLSIHSAQAQSSDGYWQQHVNYTMEVDMNVKNYQYTGTQTLVYTNNSPDTLHQVFYHLYFNAFQPGSEMDVRSRTIRDADSRVADRISKLQPDEMGFLKVANLKQDGKKVDAQTVGTILQVPLAKPILPGASTTFTLDFNGQVPVQIRRSGRNNAEGVALSMTQWFPKLAEYDVEGWHPDSYIAREFHGVWGDFDVTINIDKTYVLGASGYLQNPNEIGHGYQDAGVTPKKTKGDKLKWHFIAPQVHDFAWAADPDYVHDTYPGPNGVVLHFLYKNKPEILDNWKKLQPDTAAFMKFFNEHVGNYPYKQYSVIQGGDGGMEYAMLTLITGERKYESLAGVTAHELAHSWFQHVLASNESKNEWMDEGFTTYISTEAENVVLNENKSNPHQGSYRGYMRLATSGLEKPQTTHADRYETNFAYGIAAYSKGAIFLEQLGYVIGKDNLAKTLKRYYNDFKFKHPTPNDIMRVAEKVSGIQLDWYLTDWTKTTNTIDYAVKEVNKTEGKTTVTLSRIGLMPMPIDLQVTFDDGSSANYYIPLRMMFGQKPAEGIQRTVLPDWAWAYPEYTFNIENNKTIQKIVIDASERMADINRENNVYEAKGN